MGLCSDCYVGEAKYMFEKVLIRHTIDKEGNILITEWCDDGTDNESEFYCDSCANKHGLKCKGDIVKIIE